MGEKKDNEIMAAVRETCGQIAEDKKEINISIEEYSQYSGYSEEQLRSVPEEAQMSLGCGNSLAIAALKPGEVVLDLGCGSGFECFLAAKAVENDEYVIGVDMTPEMIDRARRIALDNGYTNVEKIEEMLVAASFENIRVKVNQESCEMVQQWSPGSNLEKYILAATIEASRPL